VTLLNYDQIAKQPLIVEPYPSQHLTKQTMPDHAAGDRPVDLMQPATAECLYHENSYPDTLYLPFVYTIFPKYPHRFWQK